jgi:hypothetical protein
MELECVLAEHIEHMRMDELAGSKADKLITRLLDRIESACFETERKKSSGSRQVTIPPSRHHRLPEILNEEMTIHGPMYRTDAMEVLPRLISGKVRCIADVLVKIANGRFPNLHALGEWPLPIASTVA